MRQLDAGKQNVEHYLHDPSALCHASNIHMPRTKAKVHETTKTAGALQQTARKLYATGEKLHESAEKSHQDAHNARMRAKRSHQKAVSDSKRINIS
jgi:hypothetical protein